MSPSPPSSTYTGGDLGPFSPRAPPPHVQHQVAVATSFLRGAKDPSWHDQSFLQSLADCLRSGAHSAHSAGAGRPPEEVMGGLGCILTLTEFLDDDV